MTVPVLIADDHEVVREGLRRLLEDTGEFSVVGEARDGLEAVQRAAQLRPRVILLDISMPVLNGLEAIRRIKDGSPDTSIVFLTMHESEQYFLEALRSGAEGYVPKSAPALEVLEAVRCAARGQVYLDPSVARFVLQGFAQNGLPRASEDPYESLTMREREVLRLIAGGMTNQEIADRLCLSPNTVHRHRSNLMEKLGLHDRMEILKYCIGRGLVEVQG